jgi:uncharacterized protein YjbI with pentapeptide repeats
MAMRPVDPSGHTQGDPIEGLIFSRTSAEPPEKAREFQDCRFEGLDLKGFPFAGKAFSECTFHQCDLSLADLNGTSLRGVRFVECKLVGARFDRCHAFLLSFQFEGCNMDLSSFHGLRLKGTRFAKCRLREADLSMVDLSNSSFVDCDLDRAVFDATILESADLRTAVNYSIDPSTNRVRKALFSREGSAGLLDRTGIIVSD